MASAWRLLSVALLVSSPGSPGSRNRDDFTSDGPMDPGDPDSCSTSGGALPGLAIPTLRGKALVLTLKLLEGFIRSQDKSLPGRSVRTSPVGGSVCGCAGLFIPAAPGVVIPALPGRALAHRRCQRERQRGCRLGLGRAQIDFRTGGFDHRDQQGSDHRQRGLLKRDELSEVVRGGDGWAPAGLAAQAQVHQCRHLSTGRGGVELDLAAGQRREGQVGRVGKARLGLGRRQVQAIGPPFQQRKGAVTIVGHDQVVKAAAGAEFEGRHRVEAAGGDGAW